MAWQAFYQNAVQRDDRVVFSIVYTDGISQKFVREYTVSALTDAVIQQTARDAVAVLSSISAPSKVTIPPGSSIDLTPPVPIVDADPARTQFRADYGLLQSMQRGVSAGLIAPDDKTLADQQAKVQSGYLSSYVGLL